MNEWLATVYGTNGANDDDQFQKTAQAQMLAKLAEEEGWDLSGLSEEELQMVANEVDRQNAAPEQQTAAPAAPTEAISADEAEKIATAKFAEADFLGRTMAHSYVQELQKIAEAMEENGGESPFPPKKKEEAKKDEGEKTAGPLTRAIQSIQGGAQSAPAEDDIEKQAKAYLESRGYQFEPAEDDLEKQARAILESRGYRFQ